MKSAFSLLILFAGAMEAQINLCSTVPEPVGPYTLVQRCDYRSQVNLPRGHAAFKAANKAGNFISVSIYIGNGYLHTVQVTDTLKNTYFKAASIGNSASENTVAMFFAEDITAGENTITVVPDSPGYIRIVIREYAGVALRSVLDATTANIGTSTEPNSGTMDTNASGDLIVAAMIGGDNELVKPCSGSVNVDYIPEPPGTKMVVLDEYQSSHGPISACLTLGSPKSWAMVAAAFKK
jgi:hypothetical protein